MKYATMFLLALLILAGVELNSQEDPTYFHQTPPSTVPEIFAPGIISKEGVYEFGSVFNAAGTEFFYGLNVNGRSQIRHSKLVGGTWSTPEIILPDDQYGYNDPFLSPDEQRLYFISQRPIDGTGDQKDYDIWYLERKPNGWSAPINAGPNINSERNEYYISFLQDGTMYYSSNKAAPDERKWEDFDVYYSPYVKGEFQESVALGEAVNTVHYEADVFVAPDESYLIFCANRPDGKGEGDLYISFKQADGSWSPSQNMGAAINTQGHELCPFVTADGKYLFYTSNQDIYWVSTEIFAEYR